MKRGTPRHPKTCDLAAALGIEQWGAVGVLESLWHFAQEFAKRGDIGRFSERAIANGIGWTGDPSALVNALVENRWLDRCPCHGLRVHDWPKHADAGVHNSSEVRSLGFLECYESLPNDPSMIAESGGVQPAMAMATAMATAEGNGNGRGPSAAVSRVFDYWREVHGRGGSKLTPKRRRKVEAMLKLYTEEQLQSAIRGCKKSDFHQGRTSKTANIHDDLELICRDGEHVEMFIGHDVGRQGVPRGRI